MNIVRKLFGVILMLFGALFGISFLNGLFPNETIDVDVNWVGKIITLIAAIAFCQLGWKWFSGNNEQSSDDRSDKT